MLHITNYTAPCNRITRCLVVLVEAIPEMVDTILNNKRLVHRAGNNKPHPVRSRRRQYHPSTNSMWYARDNTNCANAGDVTCFTWVNWAASKTLVDVDETGDEKWRCTVYCFGCHVLWRLGYKRTHSIQLVLFACALSTDCSLTRPRPRGNLALWENKNVSQMQIGEVKMSEKGRCVRGRDFLLSVLW